MAMALKKEELLTIGKYVQEHLTEWLPEQPYRSDNSIYPIELGERMVRVEEELKNQRELMKQGFDQNDKRMEMMQINMDKRFSMMFSFITIGFVVMATMMSVFQFLG